MAHQSSQDVEVIKQMISRLVEWRTAWMPIQEFVEIARIMDSAEQIPIIGLVPHLLPPSPWSFKSMCSQIYLPVFLLHSTSYASQQSAHKLT